MKIFLVRHGQASFGSANYDRLSETGHEQSRLLGDWFAQCGWPVHHVVVGGMQRHAETATAFFARYAGRPDWQEHLHCNAGFNEFDHHEVHERWRSAEAIPPGETRHGNFETDMSCAFTRWVDSQHNADYTEPWPVFSARCGAALDSVRQLAQAGENVVVFTSCGTILALCRMVLGLSGEHMVKLLWEVANTSVTCLSFKDSGFGLSAFNSTAHIDLARRPELLTFK